MGTRSRIAHYNSADNVYSSIYCHWDGYPEYNGKILQEHYNTEEKVLALLQNGDMSALNPTIEESVFYKARGEDCPMKQAKYMEISGDIEWVYVFREGQWYCKEHRKGAHWKLLSDILKK